MTEPQPLKVLGRYELLAPIGQGGMGEVHLARSHGAGGFEKLFILKTMLPRQGGDPQFVERFLHEAKVLVHLTHSNIAQVFDMGEADGQFFICIEYVAGVDVAGLESQAWASDAQVPVPVALQVGQKIAEALGYAHRKTGPDGAPLGIVHRDVSPQNVMVSYEGEVKVIDFGLAKSAARSNRTQSAMVLGKLGYLSPEQARAERVDYRSDLYSCGIVIWELLAGRPLFESGSPGEMLAQMANPKLPSLSALRPELSADLIRVVERALAVDPAERYTRADDFARALNERAIREGLTLSGEELGQYVRERCASAFASHRKLISRLSSMTRVSRPLGEVGLEATAIRRTPGPAETPLQQPAHTAVFGASVDAQAVAGGVPVASEVASPVAPGSSTGTSSSAVPSSSVASGPPAAMAPMVMGRTVMGPTVMGPNGMAPSAAVTPSAMAPTAVAPSAMAPSAMAPSTAMSPSAMASSGGTAPSAEVTPSTRSLRGLGLGVGLGLGAALLVGLGIWGGVRLTRGKAQDSHPVAVAAPSAQTAQGPARPPDPPRPVNEVAVAQTPALAPQTPEATADAEPDDVFEGPAEKEPGVRRRRKHRRKERLLAAQAAAGNSAQAAPLGTSASSKAPEPPVAAVAATASATPSASAPSGTQTPAPTAPAFVPKLSASARLDGSKLILQNLDEMAWTQCEVKLPDHRHAALAKLSPYATRSISLSDFQVEGKKLDVRVDAVTIRCHQGMAHLPVGKD